MSQEKIPMKKLTRMKLINWHRFTDCTRFSLSSPVLPAILIKRLTKMESAS